MPIRFIKASVGCCIRIASQTTYTHHGQRLTAMALGSRYSSVHGTKRQNDACARANVYLRCLALSWQWERRADGTSCHVGIQRKINLKISLWNENWLQRFRFRNGPLYFVKGKFTMPPVIEIPTRGIFYGNFSLKSPIRWVTAEPSKRFH